MNLFPKRLSRSEGKVRDTVGTFFGGLLLIVLTVTILWLAASYAWHITFQRARDTYFPNDGPLRTHEEIGFVSGQRDGRTYHYTDKGKLYIVVWNADNVETGKFCLYFENQAIQSISDKNSADGKAGKERLITSEKSSPFSFQILPSSLRHWLRCTEIEWKLSTKDNK